MLHCNLNVCKKNVHGFLFCKLPLTQRLKALISLISISKMKFKLHCFWFFSLLYLFIFLFFWCCYYCCLCSFFENLLNNCHYTSFKKIILQIYLTTRVKLQPTWCQSKSKFKIKIFWSLLVFLLTGPSLFGKDKFMP